MLSLGSVSLGEASCRVMRTLKQPCRDPQGKELSPAIHNQQGARASCLEPREKATLRSHVSRPPWKDHMGGPPWKETHERATLEGATREGHVGRTMRAGHLGRSHVNRPHWKDHMGGPLWKDHVGGPPWKEPHEQAILEVGLPALSQNHPAETPLRT